MENNLSDWHQAFQAEYGKLRLFVEQRPDHVAIALYDKVKRAFVWCAQEQNIEDAKEIAVIGARLYLANPVELPSGWTEYTAAMTEFLPPHP